MVHAELAAAQPPPASNSKVSCLRMAEQTKFAFDEESKENAPLVSNRQPTSYSSYATLETRRPRIKNRTLVVIALLVLVVAALVVVVAVAAGVATRSGTQQQLYDSIKIENLMTHLQGLQDIANSSPNNSRAVMYGYNASADQVYEKLKDAGYTNLTKQHFVMATFQDLGGHTLSAQVPIGADGEMYTFNFALSSQFNVMRYSGAGTISTGLHIETDCTTSFVGDTIALVDYTACLSQLYQVAEAAKEANVEAIIFARSEADPNANSPPNARVYEQTVDDFLVVDIPMVGINYPTAKILRDFAEQGNVTMNMFVNMTVDFHWTYNVLAYTNGVRDDSIIVFGSHLDSVPPGPGINDNGSGSAANLEIAIQMIARGTMPENQVLFAFWGAEEWGLIGSYHFVKSLSVPNRERIALNLNFDMIASPNYIRYIYNGSGADNPKIVDASAVIQQQFQDRFMSLNLPYKLTPFNGRSDYGPFIEEGIDIPAGGLFTGGDGTKTEEERLIFGGIAGATFDPCYHQYCDTIHNINEEVFEQMAQVAAYVLNTLMMKENLEEFLNTGDYDYDLQLES